MPDTFLADELAARGLSGAPSALSTALGRSYYFANTGQVAQTFVTPAQCRRIFFVNDAPVLLRQDFGLPTVTGAANVAAPAPMLLMAGERVIDVLPGTPITILPLNPAVAANVYVAPMMATATTQSVREATGLRQVMGGASRQNQNFQQQPYTRIENRAQHTFGDVLPTEVRAVYYNGYSIANGGETPNANAMTIESALELQAPAAARLFTFGGADNEVLEPGDIVISDPLFPSDFGLTKFPTSTSNANVAFLRTGVMIEVGGRWVFNHGGFENGELTISSNNAGSQILSTGGLSPTGGVNFYPGLTACAMVGKFPAGKGVNSWMVLGDSIPDGFGDSGATNGFGVTGGGYARRALNAARVPYILMTQGSDGLIGYSINSKWRRFAMQFATDLLNEQGTNDLAQGAMPAADLFRMDQQVYADARAAGVRRIHRQNLTPRVAGNYTTEPGQTVSPAQFAQGGQADTFQRLVAEAVGTPTGADYMVDIKSSVAAATGPDPLHKWANGNTNDGTHPNPVGHSSMSTGLNLHVVATPTG